MPSPFPGMDPYLEHPDIFPDFHDRFVTYVSDALQPRLPEPYYAALGRRAWIEVSVRRIVLHFPASFPFKHEWNRIPVAFGAQPG